MIRLIITSIAIGVLFGTVARTLGSLACSGKCSWGKIIIFTSSLTGAVCGIASHFILKRK